MGKFFYYFLLLLFLSYLLSIGIYVFSNGFLLSRQSQNTINQCIKLRDNCKSNEISDNCMNETMVHELIKNVNTSNAYCLPEKTKVILMVIDALKYDFGVYDENVSNPLPYQNKLPILHELLQRYPKQTHITRFIADPPTTTLQRLKGLTTGSLPTFIDIGANFGTPEIDEDNLIDQLVNNGLNAVFMGDSTWTELFPNRFLRSYAYPSFNIFDLDSVDRAIERELPNELEKNDWHLLVAHFLGVDHCGHKYGPMHMEMGRKLTEMNKVISDVILKGMDDRTTLIIIGDHGMTKSGDHGGATDDEINALLFAYTKKYEFFNDNADEQNIYNNTMQQIDLVPSISAILGIPIPYSNLGTINFNLIPDVPMAHFPHKYQIKMLHIWQNALQMHNYFYQYATDNTGIFMDSQLDDIDLKFIVLSYRVTSLYTEYAFQHFHSDLKSYLNQLLITCQNVWVKFNPSLMSNGLLIVIIVSIFIFLLFNNLQPNQMDRVIEKDVLLFIYIFFGIATLSILMINQIIYGLEYYDLLTATGYIGIVELLFFIILNWTKISDNWNSIERYSNLLLRFVFGFSVCIFFSNSFIIEEQKILSYILIGFLPIYWYELQKTNFSFDLSGRRIKILQILTSNLFKFLVIAVVSAIMLKWTQNSFRCREEQTNCTDIIIPINNIPSKLTEGIKSTIKAIPKNITNTTTTTMTGNMKKQSEVLPILVLALFVTLTRTFLRSSGNLVGYAKMIIFTRYSTIIAAVCTSGHFILTHTRLFRIKQLNIDALAWIVYTLFIIQIIIMFINPLMIYVMPKFNNNNNNQQQQYIGNSTNLIPVLFKRIRDIYETGGGARDSQRNNVDGNIRNTNATADDGDDDHIPIIYGLSTVYSSVLITFAIMFSLLIAILLGPTPAYGLFLTIGVTISFLIFSSIIRYETARNLELCLQPKFLTILTWYLLGQYIFYATSHQPTIMQIDWHAAFVGRSAKFDHSNVLSAILILLNTFGGQMLYYILFPLILLFPSCLYGILPALLPTQGVRIGKVPGSTGVYNIITVDTNEMERNHDDDDAGERTNEQGGDSSQKVNQINYHNFDIKRGEITLYENKNIFFASLFKLACQLLMLQGIRVFCSMLACTIHCRHLMVWKIFAPKFIYEGISFIVIALSMLIGYLIIIRVHYALDKVIVKLQKTK